MNSGSSGQLALILSQDLIHHGPRCIQLRRIHIAAVDIRTLPATREWVGQELAQGRAGEAIQLKELRATPKPLPMSNLVLTITHLALPPQV